MIKHKVFCGKVQYSIRDLDIIQLLETIRNNTHIFAELEYPINPYSNADDKELKTTMVLLNTDKITSIEIDVNDIEHINRDRIVEKLLK